MKMIIKTFHGLEPVLAEELKGLGGKNIQILKRAVSCTGDQRLLYRANLELRTALRVLIPIHQFRAQDENALYRGVDQVDWRKYLDVKETFAIDPVVNSSVFRHSKFAALKSKDAIVDQFRRNFGRRPDVNVLNPHLRINLHIQDQTVSLLLDSSADSLHKRGYREVGVDAPINEALAAGLLLLAGWKGDRPFFDPMCGSGTFPIEAALIATNKAPNWNREKFGFQRWRDYNATLWSEVRQQAKEKERKLEVPIVAADKAMRAAKATRINASAAGFSEEDIQVHHKAFRKQIIPADHGLCLMNPPYDERLQHDRINDLYQTIGDRLKQDFSGWDAWIISSNLEAFKHVGLRTSKKVIIFNGPLECRFVHYELFTGKRNDLIRHEKEA